MVTLDVVLDESHPARDRDGALSRRSHLQILPHIWAEVPGYVLSISANPVLPKDNVSHCRHGVPLQGIAMVGTEVPVRTPTQYTPSAIFTESAFMRMGIVPDFI